MNLSNHFDAGLGDWCIYFFVYLFNPFDAGFGDWCIRLFAYLNSSLL